MHRVRWAGWVAALLVGSWFWRPKPAVEHLRVQRLELVDDRGQVVGRLQATEGGAELVLGGLSQASLVTDGEVAAINLVGSQGIARLLAAENGHLIMAPNDAHPCVSGLTSD